MILQICRVISNNLKNSSTIFRYGICCSKVLPKSQGVTFLQKRNFFGFLKKPSIEELKIKDEVPDYYKLIYKNKMSNYLLLAQLTTSTSAVIVALVFMFTYNKETQKSTQLGNTYLESDDVFIYFAVFATFVALLQILLSKTPIRIYNYPQKKKYVLVYYGNFPFTQKTATCKAGQLIELPENNFFPSQYLVDVERHPHKIYLIEHWFHRPADLYIMLGVQRDPEADENNKEIKHCLVCFYCVQ